VVTAVFAHRGATTSAVENTLEAFAEAGRLGADGVELDVHLTADGALAVHHDARLADGRLIAGLDAAGLPGHVPLLGAALEACAGMVVNVEIKNSPGDADFDPDHRAAAAVASLVDEAGWRDQVVVSSFNAETIDAVRSADPGLPVGWLLGLTADPGGAVDEATRRGYRALHPFFTQVDADLVARARAVGLALNVWTVNADDDLEAMLGLGVDAVITDRPAEALALARGR